MVDQATFRIRAGNGGHGAVHFRREKYVPRGGPDGGDGGNGGSVWMQVDANINTLHFFAGKDAFEGESGKKGQRQKMHGSKGEGITLRVPPGTIVHEVIDGENVEMFDLKEDGEKVCVAEAGKGGKGNWHFRSSTNTTPMEYEPGTYGEERIIHLELKVLAQVGLVGLPNGGKSTLLSVITKANPKIANYPFTTLAPNLGALKIPGKDDVLIVADIPGLIEGAHEGKGLGLQFLRHIERCEILVYVLYPTDSVLEEMMNKDTQEEMAAYVTQELQAQYSEVKGELKEYKDELLSLPNIVVMNKIDLLDDSLVSSVVSAFEKEGTTLMKLSAVAHTGLDEFIDEILTIHVKI